MSPPSGWNEAYEPAILCGGGRADCPGLPRPTWKGAPAALGLGPAWLGPGGLRTLRSAQRTRGLASCALCGEFNSAIGGVSRALTGRTGYHPGLNYPYSTDPINCLARTRSAGSRQGPVLPGWRGCPTPAVSPRSTGWWLGSAIFCSQSPRIASRLPSTMTTASSSRLNSLARNDAASRVARLRLVSSRSMTLPAGNSRTGRASCGPATLTLFASSDGAMLALVDLAVQVPGGGLGPGDSPGPGPGGNGLGEGLGPWAASSGSTGWSRPASPRTFPSGW